MKKIFVLAASFVQTVLFLPFTAHAVVETGLTGANTQLLDVGSELGAAYTGTTLPELIGRFINVGLGVVGIVLVVFFVMAGYNYFTAQGDETKIKTAKKIMGNAIIGLVIIVAAYAISSFVIDALSTAITD